VAILAWEVLKMDDAARNFLWIRENATAYLGKWVVLQDGVLLTYWDSYLEARTKAYAEFELPFMITPIVSEDIPHEHFDL